MTACEEFILKMEKELPELCSTKDLVALGIYRSAQTAFYSRIRGDGPSYFKLGTRIMYLRASVIEWLKGKKRENCENPNPYFPASKMPMVSEAPRLATGGRSARLF